MRAIRLTLVLSLALAGCDQAASVGLDGSFPDAAIVDRDSGTRPDASAVFDGGLGDAGSAVDAGAPQDGGAAGADAGSPDAGALDAGPSDAVVRRMRVRRTRVRRMRVRRTGPPDAGSTTGDCVSGAVGTHAVRFRWRGSYAGSSAYVDYEINQLPDTSRWHVSAASRSFGYTPIFDDTFLGEGGLDLEGTAFIDVELSTIALSSIRNVTIAVYGRSFATTTSGSYSWMTFDGSGATPHGSIANSTPYEWYAADATDSFTPGNGGVLLRIEAGPPSDALIVSRVEIRFDAS